ncbi:MAG: replicative DNA helicase [Actinobacteria bacterium]|nr:MAG: replicative DNA helicase [Actinomycetota bacterium]
MAGEHDFGSARGDRIGSTPRSGGRVPPHNLQAEESVLGALLLSRDAVGVVGEAGLRVRDFYSPAHQHIFDVVQSLYSSSGPVDVVSVADELRRNGLLDELGGIERLNELQNATPSVSGAEHYAKIVMDTALLRRLIHTAGEITDIAFGEPDDVVKAVDLAETKMFEVAEDRVVDSTREIQELLNETMDQLEENYERGDTITGAATGYDDLDELLSGLQPSTLNIVGARPAMGKTAFGLGMATHIAKHSAKPVLFFSLEMGHAELTQRVLSSEAKVDSTKLRTGKLSESDWSKIGLAVGRLEVPLYLDDNPRVTVMEIRAKARRLKAQQGGLALIVIDYLQLMGGDGNSENRQLEVSEISRNLKVLARELEVPIVALSQLSRNLESRSDKRPMLADLRESGSLEQDADVVMFLYRDEVYNPESPDKGSAEVIVSKHRSGPIGNKRLVFLGQYTRFDNAARSM